METNQESDVLRGVQQELELNMIYDLDEESRRYTDLINIECESHDVHKLYFFIPDVETERYKNLIRYLDSKELTARNHGLTGKSANRKTHITRELRERIVKFIKAFADQVAVPLPYCLPQFKDFKRAGNVEVKEERHNIALEHINRAKTQREFYNMWCHQTTAEGSSSFLGLSFDFTQNISYPNISQRVGSAYFKAGRKCSIFGINDEKTGIQTNFLINEANDIGKGPNPTISMLHHYHVSETDIVWRKWDEYFKKFNCYLLGEAIYSMYLFHEKEEFHLQISSSPYGNLPPSIQPAGLSLEQQ
ncbi:hypothetical protein ILUMI_00463, partial [Ignelater luminosus]